MNNNRDWPVLMRWINENVISDSPDPHEFIYEHSGDLFNLDESGGEEFVGKFQAFYVDIERAMNEGTPLYSVFDGHSAELVEYHDHLFQTGDYNFNDNILKVAEDDIIDYNLLILNRIELLPKFRGEKLGLTVLHGMIARFSAGASIVAMDPFPLQCEPETEDNVKWRDRMGLDQFPSDENMAKKKLQDYFHKLGFIGLGGTSIMVVATTHLLPTNW